MQLAMLTLASLLMSQVAAQPDVDVQTPGVRVQVDDENRLRNGAEQALSEANKPLRASELIGATVKNHQDETLGDVEDIVINPASGRIEYAAISMGGFLGIGDRLFAVPMSAIEIRMQDEERQFVLNVRKETMENAEGFSEDNWPNLADPRWRSENDRRYATRPTDEDRQQSEQEVDER